MQDTEDLQTRLYGEVTPSGSPATILELLRMERLSTKRIRSLANRLGERLQVRHVEASMSCSRTVRIRVAFFVRSPVDGRVEAHRPSSLCQSADATLALLRGGALVDAADADGVTPLMCAIAQGCLRCPTAA